MDRNVKILIGVIIAAIIIVTMVAINVNKGNKTRVEKEPEYLVKEEEDPLHINKRTEPAQMYEGEE